MGWVYHPQVLGGSDMSSPYNPSASPTQFEETPSAKHSTMSLVEQRKLNINKQSTGSSGSTTLQRLSLVMTGINDNNGLIDSSHVYGFSMR